MNEYLFVNQIWLTILAIVTGPVLALLITKHLDWKRSIHEQKMHLFMILMKSRATPTSQDNIMALNLVQIVFRKNEKVVLAWSGLLDHLQDNYNYEDLDEAEINAVDKENEKKRSNLSVTLLKEIAADLSFKIGTHNHFDFGYYPMVWVRKERQEFIARTFIHDLSIGKTTLPITVHSPVKKAIIGETVSQAAPS